MKNFVIEEIYFSYSERERALIKGFSFQLEAGSITSLIGINGSGKTTILLLLLGYLKPQKGMIYFQSKEKNVSITDMNGMIGYLPQIEKIPAYFLVKDYILLGRTPYLGLFSSPTRQDREFVDQLIADLKLNNSTDCFLGEISGGELQRVRIARALAQNPEIILLDEPTTHLDIANKRMIYQILYDLKNNGRTIVFSTHDPVEALNFSDYCIMLNEDLPLEVGKSQMIINSKNLSNYFHIESEIREIDGQNIILFK